MSQARARPPLDGFKVLDLSRILAGPWCTMILADLGAEVIKVERPETGDDTRSWGPPFIGEEAAYFMCCNRSKKSIAIDFSTEEGAAQVRALARQADILVENYKAGGLERFGLDFASLSALNPALIYCSVTGYGRNSPYAAKPGYDYVVQAEGGLMSITGDPDGPPMKVGVAVGDLFTGMASAQAILAAVVARQRDGLGQHIDMALFDCQLSMLANAGSAYLATGVPPARYGAGHPSVVPYQVFPTRDADIVVAVGNQRQYESFCRTVLERPELAEDARFRSNGARVTNRDALAGLIAARLADEGAAHWLSRMEACGIPCAQVRDVGQALTSPQAASRDMVWSVDHPAHGELHLVGSPLKFSRTPVRRPEAPPVLDQHRAEILARLAP